MSDQRLSPMGIEDLVLQAIKAGATNQEEIRRRVGLKRDQISDAVTELWNREIIRFNRGAWYLKEAA